MAELTTLEEKLAEVLGLAQAAQGATEKVAGLVEAGEVGHWAVLGKLNEAAGEDELGQLVDWALPIQERHFSEAKECSLRLAGEKDPDEAS